MIKVNLTDFVSHLRKIQKRTSHAAVGEIIRGKVIRVFKEIVMTIGPHQNIYPCTEIFSRDYSASNKKQLPLVTGCCFFNRLFY